MRREEVGPEGLPCVRFDSVKDGVVWAVWEQGAGGGRSRVVSGLGLGR